MWVSVGEAVREVQSAKEPVHQLREVFLVRAAARQHVVLRNAIHAACDKVNKIDAAVSRDVAEEVLAVHERGVLRVVQKVHHTVPDKQLEQMSVLDDECAVVPAKEVEARRAAAAVVVLGDKAAVVLYHIRDDVLLRPEQRVEGLTRDVRLLAEVTDGYLGERRSL